MSMLYSPIRNTRFLVLFGFAGIMVMASNCDSAKSEGEVSGIYHASGQEFAGSETCMECHATVAQSHLLTPHFLTSQTAEPGNVKGSFDSGRNVLAINEKLRVVLEKSGAQMFQTGFVDGVEVESKPFDITIGSGRQGQTYLYWHDSSLYQLPVSYYSADDRWSNSPGYPVDRIIFDRGVPARCLECHSTNFRVNGISAGLEKFDKSQVILGVTCERCHGPSADHVAYHRAHPGEEKAMHIVNPARLTRQQRLDNCALCHSGIRDNIMPAFTFMVGDKLDDFSFPSYAADSAATLDVHGNQYGLLTSSKCFEMSDMDCSSCHNVHVKETRKLEVFSSRCMNCHKQGGENFCTQPEVPGLVLSSNCIDCHMPKLPSRQVFLRSSGMNPPTPFFVRTHLVGTYREEVVKFIDSLQEDEDISALR